MQVRKASAFQLTIVPSIYSGCKCRIEMLRLHQVEMRDGVYPYFPGQTCRQCMRQCSNTAYTGSGALLKPEVLNESARAYMYGGADPPA